ncbi:pleckstrin homology domain-containing family G member 7 [Clonorchis sinensis]|uniref:Pleckstrin homology domain-containing family G member 7 n=1 Tax=Clonorchis sinensis TaxID=79923 RepID=G7YS47_CLOSI|nr:pleckstrin homology domain-containing family G member 7 [Clonorchis sinensis]
MSSKQGKAVMVRNKLRMLRRNHTMHVDFLFLPRDSSEQEHARSLCSKEDIHNLHLDSELSGNEDRQKTSVSNDALEQIYPTDKDKEVEIAQRRGRRQAVIDEKDSHWSQLTKDEGTQPLDPEAIMMSDREICRREAVWELFKSELIFCVDHLMVLKNCFMEPLKKLQVDGYLMFVEPSNLFGNLDDLCYVSHTLCRELIGNLSRSLATKDFGSTDVLIGPLKRWAEHSKNGEVYHNYCLNYDSALTYLDTLRKHEQFNEFEKWCEQDARCRRLQLTDLLIAPMQHYMKIPLLLTSIRKYTANPSEKEMITNCLNKVESSLKSLEDKMRWLKNFERLQEIQSQLVWPAISEMEPRIFIPELLRQSLAHQPCERLIANPKRQLLHEGFLTLSDGSKIIDVFAFLFDDFFLITRIKKQPKKKSLSENPVVTRSMTEGGVFVVYRQAIALDRFTIHDIGIAEASANGLRHAIVLVLITRFQQITGVYTLQASNELDKQRWIEKLRSSQQQFQLKLKAKLHGLNPVHQTNKHSKLLTNRQNSVNTDQENVLSRDFVTIIPSTLVSSSPTTSPKKTEEKSDSQDFRDNRTILSTPSQENLPHPELPAEKSEAITSENDKKDGQSPQGPPEVYSINLGEHTISRCRMSAGPELLGSQSRQLKDSTPEPNENTTCARYSPQAKPTPGEYSPNEIPSKKKTEELRDTKVEFLYIATGRPAFSPPLSPTLHPPCASLPPEVTLPFYYEMDEDEVPREKAGQKQRFIRPGSS